MARTKRRSTAKARQVAKAPAVTVDQTKMMNLYRKDELNAHNKELKQEDFASEKEYRQALLAQYEQLRQEEYRYTVRNETLKTYNLTQDGRNANVTENRSWDGYAGNPSIIKKHEEHADTAQVQQFPKICEGMCISGKAMNNKKNIDRRTGAVRSTGAYSCAVTASALQMQISDKMGYTGKDNIIQPSKKTKLASAAEAATSVDPKYQQKGDGKMTLNEMVLQGKIGVGDEVSIVSRNSAVVRTATGKHSVTIAAINRNSAGEITSYVVQANNICCYKTINPYDKDAKSTGNKRVHNAVKTHEWVADKIADEKQKLENLTTEELAQKVAAQRKATEGVIDKLGVNEQYAATHRTLKGRGNSYLSASAESYKQEFDDLGNNFFIRRQDPMIFAPEEKSISLEELIGKTRFRTAADFKGDYLSSHVDGADKEKEAREENERIAQNVNEQTQAVVAGNTQTLPKSEEKKTKEIKEKQPAKKTISVQQLIEYTMKNRKRQ